MQELRRGSFGEHDIVEGTAFLQSWLFFGLLCEAFDEGSEVVYQYWVKDFDNEQVAQKTMYSPQLPKYLDIISRTWSSKRRKVPWARWESILRTTLDIAEKFDHVFDGRSDGPSIALLQVVWSILTLGQLLANTMSEVYGIKTHYIQEWPDSSLVTAALGARGMCPNVVHRITSTLSMESLYVLSLMPWREAEIPWVPRNHGRNPALYMPSVGRHQDCSGLECIHTNIDYDLYQTVHVLDDCDCEFKGPDMDDVYTILEAGVIPVISANLGMDEKGRINIDIDAIPSTAVAQYVAISHVWADGLGNEHYNQLPVCQLYRIISLVNELVGEPCAFWVDTLCVPRDRSKRGLALDLMNATYRQSASTLVLDASLFEFKSGLSSSRFLSAIDVEFAERLKMGSLVEIALRIFACPWTTRLWTLPEAQVPPKLCFQFFDGQIDLNDLYDQLKTWPFIGTSLISDLRSFLVRLRPKLRTQNSDIAAAEDPALLGWPGGGLDGRFISMIHAIEFRTTSRRTDEVLCMAIQLKLDVAEIMKEDTNKQLQALLKRVRRVPADLMFTHGPRLKEAPFRWAPTHLLDYKSNFHFIPAATADTPMGMIEERGLRISYPCMQFQVGNLPAAEMISLLLFEADSEGKVTSNVPRLFAITIPPRGDSPFDDPSARVMWNRSTLSQLGPDDVVQIVMGREHVPTPVQMIGLAVAQTSLEGGVAYAYPLETVVISEMDTPESPDHVQWSQVRPGKLRPAKAFCIG